MTRKDWIILAGALGLALVHGLIYFFTLPPWQHYDEPNHFEHVWLRTYLGRPVNQSDYDPEMSFQVMDSMRRNGFFKGIGYRPQLTPGSNVRILGLPQLDEKPLYYWLVSLPLRLIPAEDVQNGMYVGRAVSLLLLLLTVLAAWGTVCELTPPGHALRWMVPGTLVLLPGFVELMSAVNNDVAAITVVSLTFWGAARLVQRGFSFVTFAWTALLAGVSYYTKSTAVLSIPILGLALLFSLLRGRWTWLAYVFLAVGAIIGLAASITWGDAALVLRSTSQNIPTRTTQVAAPWGQAALQLRARASVTPSWTEPLTQPVAPRSGLSLQSNVFTVGVWMWANQPVDAQLPTLGYDRQLVVRRAKLDTTPQFYAYQVQTASVPYRLWINFDPRPRGGENVDVYYDGLLIVEGAYPVDQPPGALGLDARQGIWGGQPFTNLARNASFENSGPRVRSWLDDRGADFLPDHTRPSIILGALMDLPASGGLFYASAARVFRTFWGWFGWGHIPLQGSKPYRPLLILTLVGLAGAAWGLWRDRRNYSWGLLGLVSLTLLLGWGSVMVRNPLYLGERSILLPVARYGFPVILPTILVLCWGWWQAAGLIVQLWQRIRPVKASGDAPRQDRLTWLGFVLFAGFFLALDIWSLYSINVFYERLLYR